METKVEQYEVYASKEKNRTKIIKVASSSISTWNVVKEGSFYRVDVRFETGKVISLAFREKNDVVDAVRKLDSGFRLYIVLCKEGQSDEVYFCNNEDLGKLLETLEE